MYLIGYNLYFKIKNKMSVTAIEALEKRKEKKIMIVSS